MTPKFVETGPDIRRHELLEDVATQTTELLTKKHGIPFKTALQAGHDLADFFATHWHGQNIYMTKDAQYYMSQRDTDIYQNMRRGGADALAKKHDISRVQVYVIYSRMLRLARQKVQPSLFTTKP